MSKEVKHIVKHGSKNRVKFQLKPNEIDLCADIDQQPINFANWLHSSRMEGMTLKLELTPEVLEAIEECKRQQKKVLELKVLDWSKLSETYITI